MEWMLGRENTGLCPEPHKDKKIKKIYRRKR